MFIAAAVFVALAVLLHVYIWYLESFAWTSAARSVFGTSVEQAEATKEMAFNQGFYNLFLGVIAVVGSVLALMGHSTPGRTLIAAGTGSMLAAALLLFVTSPDKRGAALKQGALPLLAIITLLASLA